MLTSLDFIQPGQRWPPLSEKERLQKYEDNKNLFEGKPDLVFKDWNRILREDGQATIEMVLNWHKRLSTLWADLLIGEPPKITCGEFEGAEQAQLNRIMSDNDILNLCYEVILDHSRFGTGLFKIRADESRVYLEGQSPSCWFPVVNPVNVKEVTAHVLAWTWEEVKQNIFKQEQKTKYLQVEIHEKGKITTRRFIVEGENIAKQIPIEGVDEVVLTGINDFLVIPFNNIMTTDRVIGLDDYSDLDCIIHELEMRIAQMMRIMDKHSDPNMYGPESALSYNPETGEAEFKAGGKFFPCEVGDLPPGYLTWDGQLQPAFEEIKLLMDQLYTLSETSAAAFGQLQPGVVESGIALKRLFMAPLAKVNRVRMRLDPALKKALRLTSELEKARNIKGAVKLEDIHIEWRDGLPEDIREMSDIQNNNFLAGTSSLETILQQRGFDGNRLNEEVMRIKEQQTVKNPEITGL